MSYGHHKTWLCRIVKKLWRVYKQLLWSSSKFSGQPCIIKYCGIHRTFEQVHSVWQTWLLNGATQNVNKHVVLLLVSQTQPRGDHCLASWRALSIVFISSFCASFAWFMKAPGSNQCATCCRSMPLFAELQAVVLHTLISCMKSPCASSMCSWSLHDQLDCQHVGWYVSK